MTNEAMKAISGIADWKSRNLRHLTALGSQHVDDTIGIITRVEDKKEKALITPKIPRVC